MRIVLDTTAPTWTATWFAKLTADSSYTTVRATTNLASTDINSIAFGKNANFGVSSGGTIATIESFSLTSVPEPRDAPLGGLGLLTLLRRRR